jgi:hypothetical protein
MKNGASMSEIVTEALLEMHFHSALVNHFKTKYGGKFLRLLKPSPQQEAWVGFDQGYARTSLTTRELFSELRGAIQNSSTKVKKFYFGFFMQFKCVDRIVRRSRLMPPHYDPPYYRSPLSLYPNKSTDLSQHETLLRLNGVLGATVQYACAMLFDPEDIWDKPDLNKLRLVDISTAPPGWATNQQHFITFQTENDPSPFWCSEPVQGRSISFYNWAEPQAENIRPIGSEEILHYIEKSYRISIGKDVDQILTFDPHQTDQYTKLIPQSLTIIEYEKIQPESLIRKLNLAG